MARALTLLVQLQSDHAPLVVGRHDRPDYLSALDAANDADIRPLVRLFSELEIVALRSHRSSESTGSGSVPALCSTSRQPV